MNACECSYFFAIQNMCAYPLSKAFQSSVWTRFSQCQSVRIKLKVDTRTIILTIITELFHRIFEIIEVYSSKLQTPAFLLSLAYFKIR